MKTGSDKNSNSASGFKSKIHIFHVKPAISDEAANHRKFADFVAKRERDPVRSEGLSVSRAMLADALYPDEGVTLKKLRLVAGLTQVQLAAVLETSQPHVARMEAGRQEPTVSTLKRLAKALGASIEELIAAMDRQTEINEIKAR